MLYFIILILVNASVQASLITVNSGDSIQGAISAAHPGDTILVEKGIYYEHLQVSKPIALNGIGFPVLDATASGSAVTISADGIQEACREIRTKPQLKFTPIIIH